MAVVLMLTVLSLVVIYIGANCHWLYSLERELKLTEQRQIRRLNALSSTNALSAPVGGHVDAIALPLPKAAP
jgi:hypothetical protein